MPHPLQVLLMQASSSALTYGQGERSKGRSPPCPLARGRKAWGVVCGVWGVGCSAPRSVLPSVHH